ncbi:MAG TPA: alpha/beta hydrolase [Chloroflexota bacterium]|nr:alpha/beta hydrolase [Chloroflexota bacterium]
MTTLALPETAAGQTVGAMSAAIKFLERPEGRIAYEDTGGNGPLVVAVPSLGDVRQEYRFLTPHLVKAGYRAVTVDLRGHGESSVGWSEHSPEAVGADLVALVETLDAGPAVLIGTSMTGGSAAWAAAERPDLIAGIVLVNAFVRDMPVSAVQSLMLKALLVRPWGPTAWSWYYKSLYPTNPPTDLTEYRGALADNLRQPGRFEATTAFVRASKSAVERRLAEVQVPTLILFGTKDPDFKDPEAEAHLIAERLSQTAATVELIDGAGHYPQAEMPEPTAERILAFLSRLDLDSNGLRSRTAGVALHGR